MGDKTPKHPPKVKKPKPASRSPAFHNMMAHMQKTGRIDEGIQKSAHLHQERFLLGQRQAEGGNAALHGQVTERLHDCGAPRNDDEKSRYRREQGGWHQEQRGRSRERETQAGEKGAGKEGDPDEE